MREACVARCAAAGMCAMLSRPRAQRQVWTRHVARHASASRSAAPWRRWMVVAESARVGPPRVACHLPRAMPALPTCRREGELPLIQAQVSCIVMHFASGVCGFSSRGGDEGDACKRALRRRLWPRGACDPQPFIVDSRGRPSSSAAGGAADPAPPRRPQRSRSYRWSLPTSCSPARRRGRGRR